MPSDQFPVESQLVRIISVAGRQEAPPTAFAGAHDVAQGSVTERAVPDKIDAGNPSQWPLINLKNDIDPVLVEQDHLRNNRRAKPPAPPIDGKQTFLVNSHAASGKDRALAQSDLGHEVLILDSPISFEDHPIDDWIFHDAHDQCVAVTDEGDVCKKFSLKQGLQSGIQQQRVKCASDFQPSARTNR